jgi:hypothetical protein
MYNAVFKVNSYNKDYELVSLYDVDYIFENIYTTNEFESLVGIHPLIFSFIFANSKTGVSDIIEESEVIEGDLLENYLYQIIKIDNISYLFELNDFGVTKVIKLSDEDLDLTIPTLIENVDSVDDNTKVLYSVTTHSILLENMTQNTKNLIVENFGSNFELIGYNYVATSHYYNFKIGDKYYNAKYIPGYKSELNAINDTESFKEDIEKILQK